MCTISITHNKNINSGFTYGTIHFTLFTTFYNNPGACVGLLILHSRNITCVIIFMCVTVRFNTPYRDLSIKVISDFVRIPDTSCV